MFSVATDSYDLAVREIRGEFGGGVRIERVSADLGRIVSGGPSVEELAAACDRGRIIFVRHLTVELASFKPAEVPEAHELADLVLEGLSRHPQAVAVQTWTDGAGSGGSFYHLLEDALGSRGIAVTRSGQDVVVSCFVSAKTVVIGRNRLEYSLSDWPGGRMRLARSDERVSRSEFKLEEAIQTFDLRPRQVATFEHDDRISRAGDLRADFDTVGAWKDAIGGWRRIVIHDADRFAERLEREGQRQLGSDGVAVGPGVRGQEK